MQVKSVTGAAQRRFVRHITRPPGKMDALATGSGAALWLLYNPRCSPDDACCTGTPLECGEKSSSVFSHIRVNKTQAACLLSAWNEWKHKNWDLQISKRESLYTLNLPRVFWCRKQRASFTFKAEARSETQTRAGSRDARRFFGSQ